MIITKQKAFDGILATLKDYQKIFLVGCGECSTTCKTGGEADVLAMKNKLEEAGKTVTGYMIPSAPCVSAQTKTAFAKNRAAVSSADAILVLACGLGTQSVMANDRTGRVVLPGCDTIFAGAVDEKGTFVELCSACGECLLDITGGICPVTRCAKSLLNGPCGGMNKGKCEVNKDQDCAWVLIFKELDKRGKTHLLRTIQKPKDHTKTVKPHSLTLEVGNA